MNFPSRLLALMLVLSIGPAQAAPMARPKIRSSPPAATRPLPAAAASFTAVPEVEPNDTREMAQAFACGSLLTGAAIGVVGDADFVTFTVPAGHWITARTQDDPDASGPQAGDLVLTLFDAAGTQVAFNDDWAADYHPRLLYRSDAGGTYYLRVTGYDDGTIQGAYQAWVTCTLESPPANDACAGAYWIECGPISASGNIAFANDDFSLEAAGCGTANGPDYTHGGDAVYALLATGGDVLDVTCNSPGLVVLYLTDACGTPSTNCLDPGFEGWPNEPARIVFTFPRSGLYYLIVDSPFAGDGSEFTLTGSLECSVVPTRHGTWGALKLFHR